MDSGGSDSEEDGRDSPRATDALGWLHSVAVPPAGGAADAIHVPSSVQRDLLQYYANTVADLEDAVGAHECHEHGPHGAGARDGGVRGHENPNQPTDNDVPDAMARQFATPEVSTGASRRVSRGDVVESSFPQLVESELVSALGLGAAVWSGPRSASSTAVVPVAGGRAIAFIKVFHVSITWLTQRLGRLLTLCSFGGAQRSLCVEKMHRRARSSSCWHAEALQAGLARLARRTMVASLTNLVEAYPVLCDDGDAAPNPETYFTSTLRNNRKAWSVRDDKIWTALVQPIKSASNQTPRCKNILCRSRKRYVHVAAYSKYRRATAETAPSDESDGEVYRPDGVLLKGRSPEGDEDGAVTADASEACSFKRRGRKMLPCVEEVRFAKVSDSYGRAGRISTTGMGSLPTVLPERHCLHFGAERRGQPLKIKPAVLYTMRSRIAVRTGSWVCGGETCGKDVAYDGSDSGLFALSSATVFTRVYLDVVLHIALSSRSSVTASAAAMAFCLHATAGLPLSACSVTRQLLNFAVGAFRETLLVPAAAYSCIKCVSNGKCLYETLVADGQTLGFFKDKVVPLVRHLVDNPVIDILLTESAVVKNSTVRAALRKRANTSTGKPPTLTAREVKALDAFLLKGSMPRKIFTPENSATGKSSAREAEWAAAHISSFFKSVPANDPAAEPTVMSDSDEDNSSSSSENNGDDLAERGQGGRPDVAADDENEERHVGGQRFVCVRLSGAVGDDHTLGVLARERWRVVQRFVSTFMAEAVSGIFSGCDKPAIEALAQALVDGKRTVEWEPLSTAVDQLSLVWSFLYLVSDDLDADPDLARAVGELLLFGLDSEMRMEVKWWENASAEQKAITQRFAAGDRQTYLQWEAEVGIVAATSKLVTHERSTARAALQAEEQRSGSIFPGLTPVRPFTLESRAKTKRKKAEQRRAKSKAIKVPKTGRMKARRTPGKNQKAAGVERKSGKDQSPPDDACRHAFETSRVFTPGMVNFVCPHGIFVGFELLEGAESPSCIVEALSLWLPVLPKVINFGTACQASRNAVWRMPWLLRLSLVMFFLDRFHHLKRVCTNIFDAAQYPGIAIRHKTSVAEMRNSYMTQDRFITHMRLYGAFNNLRVWQKVAMQPDEDKPRPEVGHFPLPYFFHQTVVSRCERRSCRCRTLPVLPEGTSSDDGGGGGGGSAADGRDGDSGDGDVGRDWGDRGSTGGTGGGERGVEPVAVEPVQPRGGRLPGTDVAASVAPASVTDKGGRAAGRDRDDGDVRIDAIIIPTFSRW